MAKTASISRKHRASSGKARKIVESEEPSTPFKHGKRKYAATLSTTPKRSRQSKHYFARIKKFQSKSMSAAAAQALHDENRGDRWGHRLIAVSYAL